MHHDHKAHSLQLATDEAVSLAWEAFFTKALKLYDVLMERRAAKEKSVNTESTDVDVEKEAA
jgi:hypothetical protein